MNRIRASFFSSCRRCDENLRASDTPIANTSYNDADDFFVHRAARDAHRVCPDRLKFQKGTTGRERVYKLRRVLKAKLCPPVSNKTTGEVYRP